MHIALTQELEIRTQVLLVWALAIILMTAGPASVA